MAMKDNPDDYGVNLFGNQQSDEMLEELYKRGLQGTRPAAAPVVEEPVAPPIESFNSVRMRRGMGAFVIPKENTWAAHRALVLDKGLNLEYNADNYPYFDDILQQQLKYSPIYDKKSSRYEAYGALRENIAVVRNYIMCEFFPDGSVDEEDLKKVRHFAQIAEFVVDAMNNDSMFANPLKSFIRIEKANLPGSGAQYIYSKILEKQNYHSWLSPIMSIIHFIKGTTSKNWQLPSLNDSPFSDAAMLAPPPAIVTVDQEAADIALIRAALNQESLDAIHTAQSMNQLADDFTHSGIAYNGVDSLQEPTRRESVDIAKEILRKLKLVMGEALIENGLTAGANDTVSILDALKGTVRVFEYNLNKLLGLDPNILSNPSIVAANNAIGMLGFITKAEVLRKAEGLGDKDSAKKLREEIRQMPASWKDVKGKKFGELLDNLESGLNTVLLRINQVGDRDTSTQMWLGFSNANALGAQDPAMQKNNDKPQKAMDDLAAYNQINAQRQQQALAAQAAMQQRQKADADQRQRGPNASSTRQQQGTKQVQTAKTTSMSKLVNQDTAQMMRQTMATNPAMQAVQVGRRAAIQQAKQQRDKAIKQADQANRAHHAEEMHHAHEVHHAQEVAAVKSSAKSTVKSKNDLSAHAVPQSTSGIKSVFDPVSQAQQAQNLARAKRGPQFGI